MSAVKRTIMIEMDATVVDLNLFQGIVHDTFPSRWTVVTRLNDHPAAGETWKDGNGQEHLLKALHGDEYFTLRDANNKSLIWTHKGHFMYSGGSSCFTSLDKRDLIERVEKPCLPDLDIEPGQYWMDRKRDIHQIKSVDTSVSQSIKSTTNLTWTIKGRYVSDTCESDLDLVKRITINT